MAKKPVLKHLGFNAARPGAARETCRCLCNALFEAVHRHGVQQVVGIGVGIKSLLRRHDAVRVFIPKHVDDRPAGFGIQIVRAIRTSGAAIGHHPDGRTDLAAEHHGVVSARERGGIVLSSDFHSPPASTGVEVRFLDALHQCDIPSRVPGVEPIPYDRLDVVESSDPADAAEDDRLEHQRPLRVPASLNDSGPEVGQRRQEAVSPSAVGEVVQWEGARGDAVVEPLPLCVFIDADPTVEVGAIVQMDGVSEDPKEPSIGSRDPLQMRVSFAKLLLREDAGHEEPECTLYVTVGGRCGTHHRCTGRCRRCVTWCDVKNSGGPSNHPRRTSRGTSSGIQIGVGNGWCRRRKDGGRDDRPGTFIPAGTAGAAVRADSRAGAGRQGHHRCRSSENWAWRQGAEGALGNSLGGPPHPRGIEGIADGNSVNAPASLVGIHWRCSLNGRGRAHPLSCLPPPHRDNSPPPPHVEEWVEAG